MAIKRYEIGCDGPENHEHGDWIKYVEHSEIVYDLEEEIKYLQNKIRRAEEALA